jgi:hypothetical protein
MGIICRTGPETLDGCSIFIREDRFEILEEVPLSFYQPSDQQRGHLSSSNVNLKCMDRHNVALVLVLRDKQQQQQQNASLIAVANTHILFNPKVGR